MFNWVKSIKGLLFLTISFVLSILALVYVYDINTNVYANTPIQIYTIEDLDNVRNDLEADYILMNDLDFDDPNSWDNYDANYSRIMESTSFFENLEIGRANETEFEILYQIKGDTLPTVYVIM